MSTWDSSRHSLEVTLYGATDSIETGKGLQASSAPWREWPPPADAPKSRLIR